MNIKNIIICILQLIIKVLSSVISYIFYPFAYLFLDSFVHYAIKNIEEDDEYHVFKLKPGVSKFKIYCSALFWGWLFFGNRFDHDYCGPFWFKKEKKIKWFTDFRIDDQIDINSKYPIPHTFKEKIYYFWLSYLWSGIRNAAYNFGEWFFRDGRADYDTFKVYKLAMYDKSLDPTIMPSTNFKDKDGTDRSNDGPYIKYTFDTENKWECLQEGVKIVTFKTHINKERFYYGKVRVFKLNLIKKFLVIELLFGWNPYNGLNTYASRFMFKTMDDFALSDYQKYQDYLKNQ